MNNRTQIKIAVLGGDQRMLAAARRCADLGYETAVWGVHEEEDYYGYGKAVRCTDWTGAINGAGAVLLPLPVSADGIRLNAFHTESDHTPNATPELRFTHLLEMLQPEQYLFGGRFPPAFKAAAEERNFPLFDYSENELFQIANARLTAEGALEIALREYPGTLLGAPFAIIGYGRIGKCLATLLKAVGAEVTIAARKKTDLAWAEQNGCLALQIEQTAGKCSLCQLAQHCDVIFNTVPYWLFDTQVLSALSPHTKIIDLASAPGGVDPQAAAEHGIRVIRALALPGKCAPLTAGEIIADTVLAMLVREGGERT